jgi:acetyl/propionyl-CoA carboxylase alpha subunit
LSQGEALGLLQWGERLWRYRISAQGDAWQVQCTEDSQTETYLFSHVQWMDAGGELTLECNGLREQLILAITPSGLEIFYAGRAWTFDTPSRHQVQATQSQSGQVRAPLTARVLKVAVTNGQAVKSGDTLLVLEAMKMEHTLKAPFDGVVNGVQVQAGGQTLKGALLIHIEAACV